MTRGKRNAWVINMGNKFELEILLKHIKPDKTLIVIKKEAYMPPDFITCILSTLNESDIAEGVYYSDDVSCNYYKTGEYIIGLANQSSDDSDLMNVINNAVISFTKSKPVKQVHSMSEFKSCKSPRPTKEQSEKWKSALSESSLDFLKNLGSKISDDAIVNDKTGLFDFPDTAPSYMRGMHICPVVSLEACSDIFMNLYRDFLLSTAIKNAGETSHDPSVNRKIMIELTKMIDEFQKYVKDCADCPLYDECNFSQDI